MRWMARGLLLLVLASSLACAPGAPSGASAAKPSVPSGGTGAAAAAAPPAAAPAQSQAPAEWDRVLAAAHQEGTVVVNGPPGDVIRRKMLEGFTSAYPGITLEWTGGTAPEMAAKLEAERRAGIYALDVFIAGTNVMLTQVKIPGFLDPIKPALILPEVTDPANWMDGRLDFADNDGEYDLVFIHNPMIAAAHNARMVRAEEIDELPKLLDPKWKGKIVISDPLAGGQGQASFRWLWAVMGPEKATEYIRALREQAAVVDRDRRRMLEWIARGRYPILFNPDPTTLEQLAQEGITIPVLPGFKDYGTYVTPGFGSVGLVKDAPHPNAAKVYLNWLLSKDGQTAYSTALRNGSRRLDVPRDHIPPELQVQPDVKYWASYKEAEALPPPELVALLKEVFSR
jgi:ABC-type Fe3+ transport system substrate-binding protein